MGISYVCVMGGMLEQSGDGKVTYEGGPRKSTVAKEGMGLKGVRKMLKEITESDLSEHKVRCKFEIR